MGLVYPTGVALGALGVVGLCMYLFSRFPRVFFFGLVFVVFAPCFVARYRTGGNPNSPWHGADFEDASADMLFNGEGERFNVSIIQFLALPSRFCLCCHIPCGGQGEAAMTKFGQRKYIYTTGRWKNVTWKRC